ncbi:hypothetical protein TanjilG_05435 [Lupinus angustifolius]|uniref:Uncharacterized protein n=1 Tax=Lupinus angustifolius TaxID=3871 RepID=A0A1J7HPU4_LUPAN|nr:PREDICTED: uncharacterized protein LOC109343977 [Lupinus angustifolius]OIW14814.1 hypothetical protein TanjilG_05435 [Lupinus angustifolius]
MDTIRIRTPKKNYGKGTFIISSKPSENFETYAGLLNPPPRAMSLSSSVFNNQYRQQQQQPPLLPLPNVSAKIQQPQLSRSISISQGHFRRNRTKDISLTPKKSTPTKREEGKKKISATQSSISEFLIVTSENRLGPDPKDLPKNLTVLSPPPSSLPLPKFFLRSKLSCNAEAAATDGGGVDAGATNNLRQLLRLQ